MMEFTGKEGENCDDDDNDDIEGQGTMVKQT